jgi:hypothetical protein
MEEVDGGGEKVPTIDLLVSNHYYSIALSFLEAGCTLPIHEDR